MPRPMERHRDLRYERGPLRALPDVAGFLSTVRSTLGKDATRQMGRDYGDGVQALQVGAWNVVREAIDDAHADGVLSDEQYQQVLNLAADHHLPIEDT